MTYLAYIPEVPATYNLDWFLIPDSIYIYIYIYLFFFLF